ncbi:MAG: ABC transporter ATP-binding protein [Phycisphaerae bacterium]
MPKPTVHIDNISKAYRIGVAEQAIGGFRELLWSWVQAPMRNMRKYDENYDRGDDAFWALRDVSFDVHEGEVVGLIGRNGAGKSTLLKVLSRITEPTSGMATMRGRVSSLLEVGTGFHPELSGRENIYLNGAILGMHRAEIKAKFDQIVDFSEVEKFLDTPVKRYSSGMYVRLAFSVAAHLDPRIMIIDEVLAVGDAAFQKKCLGKMDDVAHGEGRTIIFVSHSMESIASLCTSCVHMQNGRAGQKQSTEGAIRDYLSALGNADGPLIERPREQHRPRPPIFHDLLIEQEDVETSVIPTGSAVRFKVLMKDFEDVPGTLSLGITFTSPRGQQVLLLNSEYQQNLTFKGAREMTITCDVDQLPLSPGKYQVELTLSDGFHNIEYVERAAEIDVVFHDYFGTGKLPKATQSVFILPARFAMA